MTTTTNIPVNADAPELTENEQLAQINSDYTERYGFHDAENYLYKAPKGINREIVEKISEFKNEPQWMRDFRLKALEHFFAKPQPTWGSPMLAEVDYDDIHYFVRASERAERSWMTSRRTSRTPSTGSASPKPSASSSPASAPSTSPRSSTTRSTRISRRRA